MTVTLSPVLSPDEIIVAYLDGELAPADRARVAEMLAQDAKLAARMADLTLDQPAVQAAFDALLAQAPVDRLQALLPPAPASLPRRRLGSLAAGFAGLLAGGLGAQLRPWDVGTGAAARTWRQAVAGYMHLYTPQTFANLGDTPALRAAQLGVIDTALGLPLSAPMLDLPGVAFQRAELLTYDHQPLAQFGYLDPNFGPMAFCVKPASFGPAAPAAEQRLGMNIVYWSSADYGYLVIGRNPPAQLQSFADALRSRITA